MNIGDKIKQARKDAGFNQLELAEKLKLKNPNLRVGNTTVSNWEKEISKPDIDILFLLVQILDLPNDYFFFDDSKNSTEPSDPATNGNEFTSTQAQKIAVLYDKASDNDKKIVDLTLEKYDNVQTVRIAARDGQKDVELTSEQRKAIIDIVSNHDNKENSDI